MNVEPSVLLAGPRGRRLCLDIAASALAFDGSPAADEYRLAAGCAAHDLDPGRGTSRVMLTSDAGEPVAARSSPADAVSPPAAVARRLEVLPLAEPDERMVLGALAAAVDFARYWQEPDGEDLLAAAPEMREALARVAGRARSYHPQSR